jgi:DNA alkylation damage repair protein AlkB
MPDCLLKLANSAAAEAGFDEFFPDACLINRYEPGSKLSLHQDWNERDFEHPIVSVSLGVSATFFFGGLRRTNKTERIPVEHGDVIVWGGPAPASLPRRYAAQGRLSSAGWPKPLQSHVPQGSVNLHVFLHRK